VLDLANLKACFMWHTSESGKATMECTSGTAGCFTNTI